MNKGEKEWVNLARSVWEPFAAYDTAKDNPTYCANKNRYAWTLEAEPNIGRGQPIIILCPDSFTKQNLYNEDIPDELDISPQPDGKVLDRMEPRLLTWYHELFHLAFDPGMYIRSNSLRTIS